MFRGTRLFTAQRILGAAGDILNFTFDLIGFAVGLKFGVTDQLADGLLRGAGDLLANADYPVFVHCLKPFPGLEFGGAGAAPSRY
jgi:hypothetical protein